MSKSRTALWALCVTSIISCSATITARGDGAGGEAPGTIEDTGPMFPMLHLRRLTQYEYTVSVNELLGANHPETQMLYPRDPRTPFDNNATDQIASEALITGAELLATESVATLMQDTARRNRVVGCTPTGPADGKCMRTLITNFGLRATRRPVPAADVERYATAALATATTDNDFYAGASVVIRAFLLHPRFLYRVEVGAAVDGQPGVFRLDGFELATRLSFLIWGLPPDDGLLAAATKGELDTPEGLQQRVTAMLSDPRATNQAQRLHAMWLDYEVLPHPPSLSDAMRKESAALVERVLMQTNRPWHDLFRDKGTFINDELAANYQLPAPGSTTPKYVAYGSSGRQGILSHGSFLSHGGTEGDRTPIHRGLAVRRGLLCETIELPAGFMPPPLSTPTPGQCRKDILSAHSTGGCAGCHTRMDPIGFGLEPFDGLGRPQLTEPDRPACTISGQGKLDDKVFQGVAGLADALVEGGKMAACFESQVYRFALGRAALDDEDRRILRSVQKTLGTNEFTYRGLMTAIATAPAFSYRRQSQ